MTITETAVESPDHTARTEPTDAGARRAGRLVVPAPVEAVGLLRRVTFEATHPQDPLTLIRYINIHLAETRRSATDPTVSAPG